MRFLSLFFILVILVQIFFMQSSFALTDSEKVNPNCKWLVSEVQNVANLMQAGGATANFIQNYFGSIQVGDDRYWATVSSGLLNWRQFQLVCSHSAAYDVSLNFSSLSVNTACSDNSQAVCRVAALPTQTVLPAGATVQINTQDKLIATFVVLNPERNAYVLQADKLKATFTSGSETKDFELGRNIEIAPAPKAYLALAFSGILPGQSGNTFASCEGEAFCNVSSLTPVRVENVALAFVATVISSDPQDRNPVNIRFLSDPPGINPNSGIFERPQSGINTKVHAVAELRNGRRIAATTVFNIPAVGPQPIVKLEPFADCAHYDAMKTHYWSLPNQPTRERKRQNPWPQPLKIFGIKKANGQDMLYEFPNLPFAGATASMFDVNGEVTYDAKGVMIPPPIAKAQYSKVILAIHKFEPNQGLGAIDTSHPIAYGVLPFGDYRTVPLQILRSDIGLNERVVATAYAVGIVGKRKSVGSVWTYVDERGINGNPSELQFTPELDKIVPMMGPMCTASSAISIPAVSGMPIPDVMKSTPGCFFSLPVVWSDIKNRVVKFTVLHQAPQNLFDTLKGIGPVDPDQETKLPFLGDKTIVRAIKLNNMLRNSLTLSKELLAPNANNRSCLERYRNLARNDLAIEYRNIGSGCATAYSKDNMCNKLILYRFNHALVYQFMALNYILWREKNPSFPTAQSVVGLPIFCSYTNNSNPPSVSGFACMKNCGINPNGVMTSWVEVPKEETITVNEFAARHWGLPSFDTAQLCPNTYNFTNAKTGYQFTGGGNFISRSRLVNTNPPVPLYFHVGRDANGDIRKPVGFSFSASWSPLVVDVQGYGIKISRFPEKAVKFDIRGDGKPIKIDWVENTESVAFLVKPEKGKVTSIAQMFGDYKARNGFESLRALDENKDGVVDERDSGFSELALWFDRNRNGKSEASELVSLASQGVYRLYLDYHQSMAEGPEHKNLIGKYFNQKAQRFYSLMDAYFYEYEDSHTEEALK